MTEWADVLAEAGGELLDQALADRGYSRVLGARPALYEDELGDHFDLLSVLDCVGAPRAVRVAYFGSDA